MLPPGVLHMSALGCFGRFTLFSPRVSHSNTCRLLSFVCSVLLFGFVALVCFCFLFCECLGIPNSPRSLDLDDRQGLIARSAMQQKKKKINVSSPVFFHHPSERAGMGRRIRENFGDRIPPLGYLVLLRCFQLGRHHCRLEETT